MSNKCIGFREATDVLIGKGCHPLHRMAVLLDVPEVSLRMARVEPGKVGARAAPAGWRDAARAVALDRIAQLREIVLALTEPKEEQRR